MNNKLRPVLKALKRELESIGLYPEFGKGWLNISKRDGTNCEFYSCVETDRDFELYAATYTVDGKVRDLNFELPYQTDEFVTTVCKILEFKPKRKRS